MFEDNFFKKFYSIKTKKLLRVLRVKGEIISLGNTILILDSNKAYLYSFRPVCTKLETNSLIIKKCAVINCGYIVTLFENGIVCIYSKDFKKIKTYKNCKDIKVKKYIFAIWYQDGKIEIIDEKLHSECINDNYELLENDCLSDNILLLYNKGRLDANLCIYLRKYRFIKYLNINSKNIIWNNNVGGFLVNDSKLVFNEYGKIMQSNIKKLCNVLNDNQWWSYEYTYNKELFECDMILTIHIYNCNFKLINTIYVADMFYENTRECKEIIKIDINSNIICSLGRYSEYNGAIFSWVTTIFDSYGYRKKVIKDIFFITQLKNNDILMSGVDKTIEIYSANYEYKMTLCKEKIDFIKELADGSLIFSKNNETFYYDADYRLINNNDTFNIDASKHDKFDYIPDKHIFIYHYDPNQPKVIHFNHDCKIENFKDYYTVVFKRGIAILYKYIDKREFFYIPEETTVIKIYKNKCLVYNEDGFSYFMFS